MDAMVVKYVGLAGIVYGIHAFLAIAQIALSMFLLANGKILLSNKKQLGKWAGRLGLTPNERLSRNPLNGWLMMLTGAERTWHPSNKSWLSTIFSGKPPFIALWKASTS